MKQLYVTLTCLLLLSFLAVGCKTIHLTDYWKDPNYKGPAFTKYLVISMASAAANRIILEDNFVRQLKAKGVEAVASYKILPPDGTINKELVREAIEGKGFDSVIIGRLIGIDVNKYQNTQDTPVGAGLYGSTKYEWYQPGYDYNTYKIETTVWQVAGENMIMKCNYDVLDPQNIPRESEKLVEQIIKEMSKVKLI